MVSTKRLFIDMDGTISAWQQGFAYETLFEEGYYLNLPPMMNVIRAIKRLIEKRPDIEFFILSACLGEYAVTEKNQYLDEFLPEIDKSHRYFIPCNCSKAKALVKAGQTITENDWLLDDYSRNLHEWVEAGGQGIKVRNAVNGTNGTWKDNTIDARCLDYKNLFMLLDMFISSPDDFDDSPYRPTGQE